MAPSRYEIQLQQRAGTEPLHTEGGPRRRGVALDPEGDPGEDHGQDTGDVGLDGEVAHTSAQVEVNRHQHVLACNWKENNDISNDTQAGDAFS